MVTFLEVKVNRVS